jgi:hypothetical protein
LEFGVWSLEFGVWSLEFGVCGFGVWDLEFGIWNLEFGIWNLILKSIKKCGQKIIPNRILIKVKNLFTLFQ